MKFEKQIEQLNAEMQKYYGCDLQNGKELNERLQKIGGLLYYLTTVRAYFHNLYETHLKELVDSGTSVSAAQNACNVKYPEMYRLRRLLEDAQRIHTALQVHISWLKAEMRNV